MLNFGEKKKAVEALEQAGRQYAGLGERTKDDAVALYELRQKTAKQVIGLAESYINELAHTPKSFKKSVSEFKVSVSRFEKVVEGTKAEADSATVKSGVGAGAAVGTGAAVMAFGPSAAMAVATTFGTASTGTAISALSGAAATNAALAWLGGGAVAAGGGGMAVGGQVMAALSGPVGWTIGGVALAGTAVWSHHRNGKIAEEATKQRGKVMAKVRALEAARREIKELKTLTRKHSGAAKKQFKHLSSDAPKSYRQFTKEQKQELAALVNNIRSLGELLNKQVT